MKIYISLVGILLLTATYSNGQSKSDSLLQALPSAKGEAKVKNYNELFRAYINSDPIKAIEFAKQALELSIEIDDKKGMAAAYNNLGVSYRNQGALDKALEYYVLSLNLYGSISNKEGIATAKNNIGNIYSFKKDYEQAMKFLDESNSLFNELNDEVKMIGSLNNLGNMHNEMQEYDQALQYYTQALELSEKHGQIFADPLNNIGNLYFKQENYQKASEYYQRALDLAQKENNLITKLNIFASLGEVYARDLQFKKAQTYLDSAMYLSNTLQAYIYEPGILKSMAFNYYNQGKMKDAYEMMVRFDIAKEKVYGEESTRKIAQMEMALDLQEKEKELEALKSQTQIQSLEIKNTRMVITLVILSIGMVVGGFNLYYHKHKTRTANLKK